MNELRFTKLEVANWRNFTDVEIALAQRAFFVGPNASGKSNLLDVFRFLHDMVAIGGGFAEAVRRRGGITSLRSLAARREPDISIKAIIGTDEEPEKWTYELVFRDLRRSKDRPPIVVKEVVSTQEEIILRRPDNEDRRDQARLRQTALEQTNSNKEFREVADFFSTIRYLHVVPQVVREPARGTGRDDPYGGDLLERINSTSDRTKRARLKNLSRALAVAVPQLSDLELYTDSKGVPHLRAKYKHWRPQGAWQTEERFSDGTLRLLGLLWALQEKGGPLLLEEPELSLHPDVARYVPGMIARAQRRGGRQTFITTHSTALLSYEGIGLDEVHLLVPSENGTKVQTGVDLSDVRRLVDSGMPVGEAIVPKARPIRPEQLTFLDV